MITCGDGDRRDSGGGGYGGVLPSGGGKYSGVPPSGEGGPSGVDRGYGDEAMTVVPCCGAFMSVCLSTLQLQVSTVSVTCALSSADYMVIENDRGKESLR